MHQTERSCKWATNPQQVHGCPEMGHDKCPRMRLCSTAPYMISPSARDEGFHSVHAHEGLDLRRGMHEAGWGMIGGSESKSFISHILHQVTLSSKLLAACSWRCRRERIWPSRRMGWTESSLTLNSSSSDR